MVLRYIIEDADNMVTCVEAGAVEVLVELVRQQSDQPTKLQEEVLIVLSRIACEADNHGMFFKAGAVDVLAQVVFERFFHCLAFCCKNTDQAGQSDI